MESRIKDIQTVLEQTIFGQEQVIRHVLVGLLAGGHVLLQGVPGVGKTRLARTVAELVGGQYKRVQFTPDLMPSDIIGNAIYNFQTGTFEIQEGPVFCNVLLADELNRTPPKTQAALLEAMEERQVSIYGETRMLPKPFFVLATQNPIEYEGTYPLPEAQIDRFLLSTTIGYPQADAELNMLKGHKAKHGAANQPLPAQLTLDELQTMLAEVEQVTIAEPVLHYIVTLVRRTRSTPRLQLGASPRAMTALLDVARAVAYLHGRSYVIPDDVLEMVKPVLRHRLILSPNTALEGVHVDEVLEELVQQVEVPR